MRVIAGWLISGKNPKQMDDSGLPPCMENPHGKTKPEGIYGGFLK